MTILFTILKIIGIILLILIALILLVLFVPVRYHVDASVDDPQPHEDFDADYYKEHLHAYVKAGWLFHLVSVTVQYPGKPVLAVRAAGFTVFTGRKKEKAPPKEKEPKETQETEKGFIEKVKSLYSRLVYYKKTLTCKSGRRAIDKIKITVSGLLKKVLPKNWEMRGTAGFGDPALGGIFLSVQGMLVPLTGGNMDLDADFQEWILDMHLQADGSIRIITVLAAALKILFDKDVRKLLHRLRRGPSKKSEGSAKEEGKPAEAAA